MPGDRAEWVRVELQNAEFWGPWSPRRDPARSLEQIFDDTLARTREGERDGTGFRFLAFENGALIGQVTLNNIVHRAFENAAMGWRITQAAQGRGLATEMVARALTFAFAPSPAGPALHRVEANIMPRNQRSLRLARRLGFRHEGLGLKMLNINGQWEDHVMCAILAEEHRTRTEANVGS